MKVAEKYLADSGKMIWLCMKVQDILPDQTWSDKYPVIP